MVTPFEYKHLCKIATQNCGNIGSFLEKRLPRPQQKVRDFSFQVHWYFEHVTFIVWHFDSSNSPPNIIQWWLSRFGKLVHPKLNTCIFDTLKSEKYAVWHTKVQKLSEITCFSGLRECFSDFQFFLRCEISNTPPHIPIVKTHPPCYSTNYKEWWWLLCVEVGGGVDGRCGGVTPNSTALSPNLLTLCINKPKERWKSLFGRKNMW